MVASPPMGLEGIVSKRRDRTHLIQTIAGLGENDKTQMRPLGLEYWNGEAAARPGGGSRSVRGVPPTGAEVHRSLRKLKREAETSPFVFVSERGAPFSMAGFARMLERVADAAGIEIKVHPHMLRHACGFKLANDGVDTRALQAYLGHRNIQHTVRYTELAPTRFKSFWKD